MGAGQIRNDREWSLTLECLGCEFSARHRNTSNACFMRRLDISRRIANDDHVTRDELSGERLLAASNGAPHQC